jgi:hypothetical protein
MPNWSTVPGFRSKSGWITSTRRNPLAAAAPAAPAPAPAPPPPPPLATIQLSQIAQSNGNNWNLIATGDFVNSFVVTIPKGSALNIPAGQHLSITSPFTLVNNGHIAIHGTVTASSGGTFINNEHIDNFGNNTLNIHGNFQNNKTMTNTGTVNIGATGNFVNADEGQLTNSGIVHNNGEFENNNTVDNYGVFNNHPESLLVNADDGQFTVHSNAILTNHNDGEIQNQIGAAITIKQGGNMFNRSVSDDFNNQGTIQTSEIVHGNIDGNNVVVTANSTGAITLGDIATTFSTNIWTMTSDATIQPSQTLTIEAGQTLVVAASRKLINTGTIRISNQGNIINDGVIHNLSGPILENGQWGYVNSQSGHMFNSGDITNNSDGIINNSYDSYLYNGNNAVMNAGGIYNVGGNLTNNGQINLFMNGMLYNDRNVNVTASTPGYRSVFTNNNGGVVTNKGGTIWNVLSDINNNGKIETFSVRYILNKSFQNEKMGGIIHNNSDIKNNNGGQIIMNDDSIFEIQGYSRLYNRGSITINSLSKMIIDSPYGNYRGYAGSTLTIGNTGTIKNNVQNTSYFTVSPTSTFNNDFGGLNGNPPVIAEPPE